MAQRYRGSRRHTRRFNWLRRGLIAALVAQGLGGLLLLLQPAKRLDATGSLLDVALDGSTVVMHAPRASGRFGDGSAFEVRARQATLDTRKPAIFGLVGVDLAFRRTPHDTLRITAGSGLLDQARETLSLKDSAMISEPRGRRIVLDEILIDLRDGRIHDLKMSPAQASENAAAMLIEALATRR